MFGFPPGPIRGGSVDVDLESLYSECNALAFYQDRRTMEVASDCDFCMLGMAGGF